jgi:hypothetical protein
MRNAAQTNAQPGIRAVRRIAIVEIEDSTGRCKLHVEAKGVALDDVRRMLEQATAGAEKEADRLNRFSKIQVVSDVPKGILEAVAKVS